MKKYIWKPLKVSLLLGLSLSVSDAHAQYSEETDYTLVDSLAIDLLKTANVPGLSISVNNKGDIIYSKGFGYADIKRGVAMSPTVQIRAASVSKVITVTALGRLASQGKIDFKAPISTYLPYVEPPYADLTIMEVAGHTSGIPHRPAKKSVKRKYYKSARELVSIASGEPLNFEPNTRYQYSTMAYNLLGGVIEEVAGMNYFDYLKDSVFIPLNMFHTVPENIKELTSKDAQSYYSKKGKLKRDRRLFNGSYKLPGAGFRSSSNDLALLMNAYSNGFIKKHIVKEMFTSNTLNNGDSTNVGIGWRLNKDINQYNTIEHAGSWQGARTVIVHYPEQELTITIMINAKCVLFIEETAQVLAQIFLQNSMTENSLDSFRGKLDVSIDWLDSTYNSKGELVLYNEKMGKLVIDSEIRFLKNNTLRSLHNNRYAMVTEFGLMLLDIQKLPMEGKVYLYRTLDDIGRFEETPLINFIPD